MTTGSSEKPFKILKVFRADTNPGGMNYVQDPFRAESEALLKINEKY